MKNKNSTCPIKYFCTNKKIYIILGLIAVIAVAVFIINKTIEPPGETIPPADLALIVERAVGEGIVEEKAVKEETIKELAKNKIINNKKNMINQNEEKIMGTLITMQTTKGDIKIELFDKDAPITVQNFLSLIEKDFYDDIIFHRVIDGFMIQGGCPLGDGTGGPGHTIPCEFIDRIENNRGTLSMANIGQPNTGGSQFFINLVDNNFLDGRHTVFGKVIEGMEIVDTIGQTEVEGIRPVEDVIIKTIEIVKK